jgi:hypothetical protein
MRCHCVMLLALSPAGVRSSEVAGKDFCYKRYALQEWLLLCVCQWYWCTRCLLCFHIAVKMLLAAI